MVSVFLVFTAIVAGLYFLLDDYPIIFGVLTIAFMIMYLLVVQFFRVPSRKTIADANDIISPCDGKVVVIEEVYEPVSESIVITWMHSVAMQRGVCVNKRMYHLLLDGCILYE